MIIRNSIKDILIAVSLLERYDPETVPSQNKIYDCFFGNIHFDDSGKRKKISSLFKEFVEVFEEGNPASSFALKQTSRKKYYLQFGNNDDEFDGAVDEFDTMVMETLTAGKIEITGVARDSNESFRKGYWDLMDNGYFPYIAYLFACLCLAMEKEYPVEMNIHPENPSDYGGPDNTDSEMTLQVIPRSIILSERFFMIGNFSDDYQRHPDESAEVKIELRDIYDLYIILPQDLGKI